MTSPYKKPPKIKPNTPVGISKSTARTCRLPTIARHRDARQKMAVEELSKRMTSVVTLARDVTDLIDEFEVEKKLRLLEKDKHRQDTRKKLEEWRTKRAESKTEASAQRIAERNRIREEMRSVITSDFNR